MDAAMERRTAEKKENECFIVLVNRFLREMYLRVEEMGSFRAEKLPVKEKMNAKLQVVQK